MPPTPQRKNNRNQIYLNNPSLPAAHSEFEYSPDMVAELEKCKEDLLHFAENYFYIISLDEGKIKIKLHPYQKRALNMIKNNRWNLFLFARQTGKALSLDTEILTTNGWKNNGDIIVGDYVFNEFGKPVRVTHTHEILYGKTSYLVTFDNGQEIIACDEHLWYTKTNNVGSVKTTKEIVDTFNDLHIIPKVTNSSEIKKLGIQIKEDNNDFHIIEKIENIDSVPMRCITVDNPTGLYLAGKQLIPTHNSTIATIYLLWTALFFDDQRILLVANKEATAKEIFKRIRTAYEMLPNWLKSPVEYYGLESLELQNGSRISISTTTGTAARGQSANLLFIDEADYIQANLLEDFWASVYPIISSSKKSKVIMTSTPRDTSGLFYKLYDGAVKKENGWAYMKVLWYEVPGRGDKWKKEVIGSLGDPKIFKKEFECCIYETLIDIILNNDNKLKIKIGELNDFINTFPITSIKVLTPSGYKPFEAIQKLYKECIKISTNDSYLECSLNHPICVDIENKTFKKANELVIGDKVYTINGYSDIISIENIGSHEVFDLLNVDTNEYYTNGILSHNCEFDVVGSSGIDVEQFDRMRIKTRKPVYTLEDGNYLIWDKPKSDRIYVAGVDIAEGLGKDYTCIQILDITNPANINQVAVYSNNKISPTEFTPKLREILKTWGDPIAMIERNGCGGITIDSLKRDFDYPTIVTYGVANASGAYTRQLLGITSHVNSKMKAIEHQRYYINTVDTIQINDVQTVLELKDFVKHSNDKWGAKAGSNDDRVMALTWALMVLHDDLCNQFFDVEKKNEFGKPLVMTLSDWGVKGYINDNSFYADNENMDALPVLMGGKQDGNPDFDDLASSGWIPYR